MQIGMYWYDDDKKTDLDSKVKRAAEYYFNKYGQQPDTCYIHTSMLEGASRMCGDVRVRSINNVIRNHFWLGVSEG